MCDQDLSHSLDILKYLSVNIVPQVVIHNACGTWHSLCMVESIQSTQKSTINSPLETRKQLIQWMAEDLRVKIEIEWISKKVWRKRKEKMFRLRSWLLLHVKQYKNCCWRTFVIRKCIASYTYILLVLDHMMK